MTPSFAVKLFINRMIWLRLARACPFTSWRVTLYRLMGVRIGDDVFVGFDVDFDTNHPELIEVGNHVTISHRCMIVSHMATDVATPRSGSIRRSRHRLRSATARGSASPSRRASTLRDELPPNRDRLDLHAGARG